MKDNGLERDCKIEVDNIRKKIYSYEKSLIRKKCVSYSTLDELESVMPGRFRIYLKEIIFECFLYFNETELPDKLIVMYNGAINRSLSLPVFRRWSYYSMIESLHGAMLCIFDPMLYKYSDLSLGWYYGNKDESWIELSTEIVKAICKYLSISYSSTIFCGSSGGGYSSIYAASLFDGSLSIALNPQVYIQSYKYAKTFKKVTGIDLNEHDPLHRNALHYMIQNSTSNFCILFNAECEHDVTHHLNPLCDHLGILPRYGLNIKDNVLLWMYDAIGVPNPHESQETRSIFLAICHIAMAFHKGHISDSIRNLAFCVNEFWYETYLYKKEKKEFELCTKEKENIQNQLAFYDKCCMALRRNTWSKDTHIDDYDNHVLPWQELFELQSILERHHPQNILELGLGESSKLLALYAHSVGARHLILDEDKEWSQSFLRRTPSFFRDTKVYISPLLNAEKGGYKYRAFRDFPRLAGNTRYDFLILHRPRGGDGCYPHMDIVPRLPGIASENFVLLLEHSDGIEEQELIKDISTVLEKNRIPIRKREISTNNGELCILSSCKEEDGGYAD